MRLGYILKELRCVLERVIVQDVAGTRMVQVPALLQQQFRLREGSPVELLVRQDDVSFGTRWGVSSAATGLF